MIRPAFAAIALLCGVMTVDAADTTVSGTVKQVDSENWSITVSVTKGEKSYDVLKKAKVSINGVAGTLKEVGPGMQATLTYNNELEVVTAITAKGKAALKPEVVELVEIPRGPAVIRPYVTPDAKTLMFYSGQPGGKQWSIQMSNRKSTDVLFSEPKPLFSGYDPTITDDGREIYYTGDGAKIMRAVRDTADNSITRPQIVPELQDLQLRRPCLCNHDLTMYFGKVPRPKGDPLTLIRVTRTEKSSKWGKPEEVSVDSDEPFLFYFTVSADGKRLFVSGRLAEGRSSNVLIFSLSKDGKKFEKPMVVKVGDKPITMYSPAWVEATKEIYFDSPSTDNQKEVRLYVLRNFDPAIHIVEFKKN